jgi:acyl-CoA synthetase (AMP-forming)/AMP-acid ligase II
MRFENLSTSLTTLSVRLEASPLIEHTSIAVKMPAKSPFPDLDIPDVGIWDILFERKNRPFPDSQGTQIALPTYLTANADYVAVILHDPYASRSYTYGQLKQAATDFGKGLRSLWDWQKGDVLGIYSPNNIDVPAVIWGTHYAGGIVSPANPGYTAEELAFQLRDSGAVALVTEVPQLKIALQAAKMVGIPENRIILIGDQRDPEGRFKHFTSIRNISGTERYRRVKVNPDKDLAFLVYSSGTTGKPKGVMLSHRNIVANVLQGLAYEPQLTEKDNILAFLPFFHIYGLTCILHFSVYRGNKCVVMPKFDIEDWCRIVQDHKITFAYMVPPVVLLLSKHPCVDKYDLSTIRMMNSGAAPLTKEIVDAVYKRTKLKVKQGYGLSETSPTTHMQDWADWQTHIGSVGKMLPNQVAKFMSPEEKELPVGEVGELWIKGPNIFKGYLNNPEGTKNALTDDDYFKTGDVGYLDKEGNFYITDRVKELIKYKGFQVPPAELEGLLASHEKINDVAVMGIYREDIASEVPLAYVVPKQGVQVGPELEKEIVGWLASKVANHKRLRGGVKFTDEIPKSASGKILRRLLKDKYLKETANAPKAKL